MYVKNGSLNYALCQGIVRGNVFSPQAGVAKMNVQVKDTRKNPNTNRYPIFILNFTGYGDIAEQLKKCRDKSIVLLRYHLDNRVKINLATGVSTVEEEMIVDEIVTTPSETRHQIAYLNKGFFQGVYIGTVLQPNADSIYSVSVLLENEQKKNKTHLHFMVYGVLGEHIMNSFCKGETVLIEFKVEKSKRMLADGTGEYFTNYVIERIG